MKDLEAELGYDQHVGIVEPWFGIIKLEKMQTVNKRWDILLGFYRHKNLAVIGIEVMVYGMFS